MEWIHKPPPTYLTPEVYLDEGRRVSGRRDESVRSVLVRSRVAGLKQSIAGGFGFDQVRRILPSDLFLG